MAMRDCRFCKFYDGFINFVCSGCDVFHAAIRKTNETIAEINSEPSQEEKDHFKQLWNEVLK